MKRFHNDLFIKLVWIFFLVFSFFILIEGTLRITGFAITSNQRMQNEWKPKYNNEIRILTIGESTTANGPQSWPEQLETILNNRSGKKFVVFNGAYGGTRTSFILSRIQKQLKEYKPDIVISMMGINDKIFGVDTIYEDRVSDKLKLFFEDLRTYKLIFYVCNYFKSEKPNEFSEKIPPILQKTLDKAENFYDKGNSEKAGQYFLKAVKLFPNSSQANLQLGLFYWNTNHFNESLAQYQKAFELSKKPNAILYSAMGDVYFNRNNFKRAKEMFEKGEKLQNKDWDFTSLEKILKLQNMTKKEIENYYRKWGFDFSLKEQMSNYNITKYHYNKLYNILAKNNITLIAMQYPTLNVSDLKKMLNYNPKIIFIENKKNFDKVLNNHNINDLFVDLFGGTFGHATSKGNKLIAENVASVILNLTGNP